MNYPSDVRESDIPGFRPQDEAAQRAIEDFDIEDTLDFIENNDFDVVGCVVWDEAETWFLESDYPAALSEGQTISRWGTNKQWSRLHFKTQWDAVAYAIAFHPELDAAVEEHALEEARDAWYG